MTNTWSNEIIIDFLNEVQVHPELWDIKAKIYKDRNAKKDGWNDIAEKFGITSTEAYKKFRSLRTYAHNEEKKKSSRADGKTVKWFAFDAISFILRQNNANTGVTETSDTDISVDPGEIVEIELTDSLETLDTAQKPRTKKPKNPRIEKAQNICDAGNKKRNEYAAFGEHVANKLSKYDDYTRAQAELKIMQILFECDMTMYGTQDTQSPHNNS